MGVSDSVFGKVTKRDNFYKPIKNSVDFSHMILRAIAQHMGSLASPPCDLG